jgi:hypothetical protein
VIVPCDHSFGLEASVRVGRGFFFTNGNPSWGPRKVSSPNVQTVTAHVGQGLALLTSSGGASDLSKLPCGGPGKLLNRSNTMRAIIPKNPIPLQ